VEKATAAAIPAKVSSAAIREKGYPAMQVLINGGRKANGKPRQSPHAQIRYGIRIANLRALTAGEFYLDKIAKGEHVTLEEAALRHGSGIVYVRAAIAVIKASDQDWIDCALRGKRSILRVAKLLAPQVKAIEAIKKASPANLKAIYRETGFTNELSTFWSTVRPRNAPRPRPSSAPARFGTKWSHHWWRELTPRTRVPRLLDSAVRANAAAPS
jgi:hypothetical protein